MGATCTSAVYLSRALSNISTSDPIVVYALESIYFCCICLSLPISLSLYPCLLIFLSVYLCLCLSVSVYHLYICRDWNICLSVYLCQESIYLCFDVMSARRIFS